MSHACALSLCFLPMVALGASVDGELKAGVKRFEAGYRAWDADRLQEAASLFSKVCAARPQSYEAYYWLGATRFHILLHRLGDEQNPPDKKEKHRLLDEAVAPLERAVELNEKDSEARALLGTLLGMRIAADPKSALWLGRDVLKHRRVALENDPANPRAQYLTGTAYFHMPAFLGRKDKGLEFFLRAEELFQKEQALTRAPLQPSWGYGTCLTFIGRIYGDTGKTREARAYLKRALSENPEDKLARKCLEDLGGAEGKHAQR